MTVDAIVPTYQGKHWLETSIPQIKQQVNRVIVIDGGSDDGTDEFCAEQGVECHLFHGNPGFAEKCNSGASLSDAEALLFLNNDVRIDRANAVKRLSSCFEQEGVGLVGARGAFFAPDYTFAGESESSSDRIDYIPFWCAMVPRKVFDEVGPLDEAFGMGYSEDADYALRVEKRGYKLAAAPDCGIVHLGGNGSTAKSAGYTDESLRQHCLKNVAYLREKHHLPRILVVRLDAFGDVLMVAPAVKKLREKYPTARIFWLVRKPCVDAVKMCDCADVVLTLEDPGATKLIEEERFDLIFNFNDYPIDLVVNMRLRGERVFGSYVVEDQLPAEMGGGTQKTFDKRTWRIGKEITTQRQWHALTAQVKIESEAPPIAKRYCLDSSYELPLSRGPLIALAGGSSGEAKCIPIPLVQEFVSRLNQRGFTVVLLGAMNHDQLISHACKDYDVVDLICRTTFGQLPGIVSRCRGVLTTDSGIRHVAVGCGVPSVALFTAADPKSCGNYVGHVDLSAEIWCSPCWEKTTDFTCPMGGFAHLACWRQFDPDYVVNALVSLMNGGSA